MVTCKTAAIVLVTDLLGEATEALTAPEQFQGVKQHHQGGEKRRGTQGGREQQQQKEQVRADHDESMQLQSSSIRAVIRTQCVTRFQHVTVWMYGNCDMIVRDKRDAETGAPV